MKCDRCFLHESAKAPVWGEGPHRARLILIGESPGKAENATGRPFVGPAGALLNHILVKLGIRREDCYITNVLKCFPPEGKLPTGAQRDECLEMCAGEYLWEELHSLTKWPPVLRDKRRSSVILFGAIALYAFTEELLISRREGQEVKPGIWCSYHPAFALRRPAMELNIYRTIYKACQAVKIPVKRRGWKAGMYPYEMKE